VSAVGNQCLCLDVVEGANAICELHDRLYAGPLAVHRHDRFKYVPDMTIGRTDNEATCAAWRAELSALTTRFEANVDEVVVERIADDEMGTIESRVPLRSAR